MVLPDMGYAVVSFNKIHLLQPYSGGGLLKDERQGVILNKSIGQLYEMTN